MSWNSVRGRVLIGRPPIAAAPPTGAVEPPTLLIKQTLSSLPGTPTVFTSTGIAPAGSVVVAVLMNQDGGPVNFVDSVDPGTAWVRQGPINSSILNLTIYKRIVPAGGFNTSTTFTVTWGGSFGPTSAALIVDCFASGNAIPAGNDGNSPGSGATISQAVTGPTLATSYQVAAIGAQINTGATGPDAGSTGGWVLDQNATTSTGYGVRVYWRKATSAGGTTTLNETLVGSAYVAEWVEVGSP